MSKLEESIGFYRKMSDLQEKLRRSEEERLQLEEKFALLMRACRDEEEVRLNNLRERFEAFLEEEKHRKERNDRILQTLDRIESRAAILTAKSERLKLLRKHYEVYMLRMYPGWKYVNSRLADTPLPAQSLHSKLDLGSEHNFPYTGVTSTPSSFSADIVTGAQVPSYQHSYPINHAVNQTLSSASQHYPAANQPVPPYSQVYPTVNQPLPSSHPYSSTNQHLPPGSHPYPIVNQATSGIQPYSSGSQPYPVPGVMPIPRQTYPSVHPYPLPSVAPTVQQRPTVPGEVAGQPYVIPGVSPQFAATGVTSISATQPLSRLTTSHETAPSAKILDTKSALKPVTNITGTKVQPSTDTNYSVQKQQEGRLISEQDDASQEINQAKKMDEIDGYLGRAAEMLKISGINVNNDKSNFQNLSAVMPQSLKDNRHLGNSVDIELEQNTSGDILNVTLSDDGILQDEPSKTLVSPSQKSDENKHIHFTDDTNLEMLEEVSHDVNPQEGGGGDIAATSVSFDKQQENVRDGRLQGAGDSIIPENGHLKENISRIEEEGDILKGKSSNSPVNEVKLKEMENNKTPESATITEEVVRSQDETNENFGEYAEGEQQYAEQQQWDENTAQYYQQDGQYYQYGDEMYQQEYGEGEYEQQYAEGQYDQQYTQGDYDQQFEEYNQQYTEEEYREYERQLLQQQQEQQSRGEDNGKFSNQTLEPEQKQENYEQTQQYEQQQQSQSDLAAQHEQQQQQSHDDEPTQYERQQQSQDDQLTQHEQQQQQSQDDQPTQQHEDQRHESDAEKQIPEVVPAENVTESQTNQFGGSNQLQEKEVLELKVTESKQQETGEVQQAVVDPAVDSESSREDVKRGVQPQQIEFSSDVTDPSLSAEKVEQYRQLLGVNAAGEPETSDTDELEAQLAALVDTKHDGDKQKEQPQKAVASEKKTPEPAVKPTAEDTTTSSNSKPEAIADVKQELKPAVMQKTSRPVSKMLPDLNKVLESDSESLQLDATVSNAESDDFDFSSEK